MKAKREERKKNSSFVISNKINIFILKFIVNEKEMDYREIAIFDLEFT
jgi:hypothetical protein